jgi:hypothetical protein
MLLSLQSFFRSGTPGRTRWLSAPAARIHMGQIQRAMLGTLEDTLLPPRFAALKLRIQHAEDAECLWYLRSELMQALASSHGELRAAAELARITDMFHDVLAGGLASCLTKRRAPSPV